MQTVLSTLLFSTAGSKVAMRVLVLLLVAVVITTANARSFLKGYASVEERKQFMDEAVKEAKATMMANELARAKVTSQNEKEGKYTSSQLLAKFKKPSEDARKMGKANLLYRDIIHRAERKLFDLKHTRFAETATDFRTEYTMLFHRPGSTLTSEEIGRAWQESENEIFRQPRKPPSCLFPTVYLYRTIDGTCNNINKPLLGASGTAYRRLVPPFYEDGVSSLRGTKQSLDGTPYQRPTPSARFISSIVVGDIHKDETPFTHLLMQWGQFLDHDFTISPELEEKCSGCTYSDICQPILVHSKDTSFGVGTRNNGNCLPFRRSIPIFDMERPTTVVPWEQINDVTSFIDGSMIYGSRLQQSLSLRLFRGGLLLEGASFPSNKPSLPIDTKRLVACPNRMDCFLCGDVRCNEQISLTVMHTIWLREHNRCAREMTKINPHWNDEKLYQVCRKIVGALIQKITYEDFLPKLLGVKNVHKFIGPYRGYDPMVDPRIPNSFATAAYRFGHSLVRSTFDRLDNHYGHLPIGPLSLANAFFSPDQFKTSLGTDPMMRGWVNVNSRKIDEFMTSVLTTQLFQTSLSPGLDLASLNLQRGRDHGLPSYHTFQDFCIQRFDVKSKIEQLTTQNLFIKLYGSQDNADVWLSGLAEASLDDGPLGSTFACILGLTFQGLREGDRFFWQRPGIFTPEQSLSIGRDSISRVICKNSDGINSIQPDGFLSNQSRVLCSNLPRVDLNLFREPACFFRVIMLQRHFTGAVFIFSKSTQSQYDFGFRLIPANKNIITCIPVQCPTATTPTHAIVFSFLNLLSHTVLISNKNLPKTSATHPAVYSALWKHTDFDTGKGLFRNSKCEGLEASLLFKFVSSSASQGLQDVSAESAAQTDDYTGRLQRSYADITHKEAETRGPLAELPSIDLQHSYEDIMGMSKEARDPLPELPNPDTNSDLKRLYAGMQMIKEARDQLPELPSMDISSVLQHSYADIKQINKEEETRGLLAELPSIDLQRSFANIMGMSKETRDPLAELPSIDLQRSVANIMGMSKEARDPLPELPNPDTNSDLKRLYAGMQMNKEARDPLSMLPSTDTNSVLQRLYEYTAQMNEEEEIPDLEDMPPRNDTQLPYMDMEKMKLPGMILDMMPSDNKTVERERTGAADFDLTGEERKLEQTKKIVSMLQQLEEAVEDLK